MTTAITIDSHAGWDAEVQVIQVDSEGKMASQELKVVPKLTKETIYIHSHLQLGGVREVKP